MLCGARHPGHAAGLILLSAVARFDLGRLADGTARWRPVQSNHSRAPLTSIRIDFPSSPAPHAGAPAPAASMPCQKPFRDAPRSGPPAGATCHRGRVRVVGGEGIARITRRYAEWLSR